MNYAYLLLAIFMLAMALDELVEALIDGRPRSSMGTGEKILHLAAFSLFATAGIVFLGSAGVIS